MMVVLMILVLNVRQGYVQKHVKSTLHVPSASLEDVLDLLQSVLDVVRDGIALALGRKRVGLVGAFAWTVLGLGELCTIVSPNDVQRTKSIEHLLPLTRM